MHAWLIAALVVSWVLVLALAGLLYVLMKQHGELIMYQQDLDHRLEISSYYEGQRLAGAPDEMPQGLALGDEAPSFVLPDLEGHERSLEDYRGEPFVIAFFSTTCGYCKEMSPRLGDLSKKGHRFVLVTRGDVDENRKLAEEDNWRCDVVIEPEYDVMMAYQAMGTPAGYLVDAEGRIASGLAMGADSVLALTTAQPSEPGENGHGDAARVRLGGSGDPTEQAAGEQGQATATATALKTRGVSESKLARDGLEAGAIAPNFVLPDLDGKAHSLGDYRGKRVLLVFSDVDCQPCEQLAPELVRLHEGTKNLEIVMISRGDQEANRIKASAFGFSFPVLLQRSWEISKLYGMFATPIGYLIDENGVIAKDVAVGPEPILDLV